MQKNKKIQPAEKTIPHYLIILLIIATGIISYHRLIFKGAFLFDDQALIIDNPFIKSFSYLKDIFTTHLFYGSGIYSNFYRPIQSLSFMLDYHLWHLNPFGYHIGNLFIHILNAVCVYFLIYVISKKQLAAFISSILFCVHTVLSGPVYYISARADLLSALFFLLTITLYVLYTKEEISTKGILLLLCSILCFVLAVLSKEVALIAPFMLILYNMCFGRAKTFNRSRKPAALIWPYFTILIVYIFLRATSLNFTGDKLSQTTTAVFPLYIRLFTMSKVFMIYLRLLLFPVGLHMEWNIEPASSFFQDEVFLSIVGILVVFIFSYLLFRTSRQKFFFIAWFFMMLLPYSNVFPLNYFMGEGWLYVPSIGFFGLVLLYLSEWRLKSKALSLVIIALLVFMIAAYMVLTVKRADVWLDPVKLYNEVLKYSPKSGKARINLGTILAKSGAYEEAIQKYKEALKIAPNDAGAHASLGTAYANIKKYDLALDEFKKSVELNPKDYIAHNNIGILYKQKGEIKKAMQEYSEALKLNPNYSPTYNNIGNIYLEQGQYDSAIGFYKKALNLDPNEAIFYANLGKAYRNKGMRDNARESFQNALELNPENQDALEGLKSL